MKNISYNITFSFYINNFSFNSRSRSQDLSHTYINYSWQDFSELAISMNLFSCKSWVSSNLWIYFTSCLETLQFFNNIQQMLCNSWSLENAKTGLCRGQGLYPVTDSWHANGDNILAWWWICATSECKNDETDAMLKAYTRNCIIQSELYACKNPSHGPGTLIVLFTF